MPAGGVRLNFQVPDFLPIERDLVVLGGIECILVWRAGTKTLYRKVTECDRCGKCCEQAAAQWPFPVINGYCVHRVLEGEGLSTYMCALGPHRPYTCCRDVPEVENHPDCAITWEVV